MLRIRGFVAVFICACIPITCAYGSTLPKVSLHTAFTPDRLGASTTVTINFTITTANGEAPSPTTEVDFRLPAGMALANSTLGLITCDLTVLETFGETACPPDSVIGKGTAIVEVGPVNESVQITAFMGRSQAGRTVVLFNAEGFSPIAAQLVFPGRVYDAAPPYGLLLKTVVPITPTVPGGPDAAVVRLDSYIGPRHLTYYRRSHGKRVSYSPDGMSVPLRCPVGGFQFAANFYFQNGSSTSARSVVPCPSRRKGRGEK
jgi:hypothetical protein